jgi:hypothetical protein
MITLIAVLSLISTSFAPHPPAGASDLCQYWADQYWVAEEGVREHTLRSWGCQVVTALPGRALWGRDRTSCGVQAFRFARVGVTGDALTAAMNKRGRCDQGEDGGWYPVQRRR